MKESLKKTAFSIIATLCLSTIYAQQIVDSVLYIAEGTTSIKGQAYYGKTNFNKVVIPSSVTKIGGLAFHSCTNLKEVEIPASIDTIGNAAFQNCTSLTNVILHDGLKSWSYRIFKNIAIREITIPASVTEFESEIFANCDILTTIRVDQYSEAHAFFNTDERMELTDNEPAQTKEQWIATAKYNILDDTVLYVGHAVTKINDNQYKNNLSISEIRFTETLEKIGPNAFRGVKGLKKIVIPGNVKVIGDGAFASCSNLEEAVFEEGVEQINVYAFYSCPKLNSVTMPLSLQKIVPDGLYWENKSTRVFHCYAGSAAYNLAQKNNYQTDIIDVDKQCADSITELNFSGNTVINQLSAECANVQTIKLGLNVEKIAAEVFRKYPVARIDLNNDLAEIGENAFNDETMLRVKRNTYADTWAKANGYYLCGVLADLNVYTKDASKPIEEDFTRILCDDDSYANWTSYEFTIQNPLKLEEVDDKLVLTSFMLYPCENVTVTDKDGKALISNKTIQPLTRTVLCDFDFITDSVGNYTLTTDDDFYKRLVSIPTKWTISFNGFVRRPSTSEENHCWTAHTVHFREWIAGIYNAAFLIGLPEYEERCYAAVENKTLVTNEELTEFLTREQMENLLKKTKDYSLVLGRCEGGFGLGGGNTLYLDNKWIFGLSEGIPNGFWHEFSHCMGWAHSQGNMCYLGRPEPFNEDWPAIGNKLFQEEFKKGTPPYIEGKSLFNANFFSKEELTPIDPDDDVVIDSVLQIAEGMPGVTSHKNQTDFTNVVIPQSVEVIKNSAFLGTKISAVELPSSVKRIEKLAFQNCADLQSATIPDGVKSIGDAAFQNCTSLTTAEIGSGLRELNYRLFKGSGLTEITVPANVKVIGKECFQDCANLKNVVIADGVRKIDNSAFKNTAIEEIEIPASVTEIGTGITPKTAIWIVEKDSYAHQFAIENNQTFRLKSGENTDNNENEEHDTETSVTEQFTNTNIYAHDHTIVVENAIDEIRVYDAMGRLVCRNVACRVHSITVEKSGVYIIKTGDVAKIVAVW